MSDVLKQTISFLASFKIFFFNILIFLLFGIAFLFLGQSICGEFSMCGLIETVNSSFTDFIKVDFRDYENGARTLVFSYIWGLLLWAFARLCFPRRLRRFFDRSTKQNATENSNEKPTGDVDIYIFLGKKDNSLLADVHFLNLFQTSIARLLFGFITFSIVFFSTWTYLVFLMGAAGVIILLFILNIIADGEVNSFGEQIQNRIDKDKEQNKS